MDERSMNFDTETTMSKSSSRKGILSVIEKNLEITNWKVQLFKHTVLLACLIGFSIQVYEFSKIYYSYPTRIDFAVTEPSDFIWPALTVCNGDPVRRGEFCYERPEDCETPDNLKEFCQSKSFYRCQENDYFLMPKQNNYTYEEVMKYGYPSPFDTERPEHESGPYYFEDPNTREILTCFGYNVHPEDTMDLDPVVYDRSPFEGPTAYHMIYLQFHVKDVSRVDRPHIFFSIHSPLEYVNPAVSRDLFLPYHHYTLIISTEEEHRLPPPYDTECVDYEGNWLKHNRTGPRSQQICRDRCRSRLSLQCHNCVHPVITVPENRTICPYIDQYYDCTDERFMPEFNQCYSSCKPACRDVKYNYKLLDVPFPNESDVSLIEIRFPKREILVMSHKKKYEGVELFSNIGGFMGCWIGFSICSILSLFAYIFHIARDAIFCKGCSSTKKPNMSQV
ncbi:uncharacterized protein LOC118200633 [Stegodyphus dumicola]|uniref:uncharacterized protein LOC118200633 n=1 Tax=Stegodyphus dumicola TaxID=202533 RepID=UPI0015AEAD0B|nr:uncharacterized protein LOC118200633 [Stegodyphus dumicola]